ncbi:uncharacterized protein ACA1_158560 [Acanthamoeba castellanii str. Neff]|uniref:Uncharacterized protein n=1 Tax=Acanthamoeba castellanii (strain ATCC 30010 / Neff) TaxID=1257118 RepID=L8HCJ8_ACACF|nr:uncharacterized protein ACA1_158560 [Acanthamoeba castellanii str. Neff]ELR22081.1 hypothetical protein ACA1_158560 [Acanthamoeba castellanii str. Neff]
MSAGRHQYGDNVYCWSQYQISFQIEGEEFQVTHGETQSTFCPYEDEITIPEVERLAELREKWHTPLDADTLHCLFGFLLPYDDIAQAYNFHMVILSSQDEDIDE